MALRISALVPVLNEEAVIAQTLAGLGAAGLSEVIVVDGGSTDQTVERAQPLADRVLAARGGLFAQLNRAAVEARGDVFLFHYADVSFPHLGRAAIESLLEEPGIVGGAFCLDFDSSRPCYRVIAGGTSLRNRLGVGPFGDQSIFVRAEVFRRLGGFEPGAFLPDLGLVRRLQRQGGFKILKERVLASPRRWEKRGVFPTLCEHWWLTALHVVTGGRGLRWAADRVRDLTTTR